MSTSIVSRKENPAAGRSRYRTNTRSRKIVLFLNVPFPTMLEIFLHSFPTNKKLPSHLVAVLSI
ncbi:hypothetical protein NQ315_000085 [Exocentrus adspersus]|uniref:Uncharacterized protein n=1 Tax=Exocentrus adspersus TaxID=1586481 RepID=A0AAV8VUD7_9CUCU|nr:hypothetical protein NQ315_000085 [Exocentrus adspersus]